MYFVKALNSYRIYFIYIYIHIYVFILYSVYVNLYTNFIYRIKYTVSLQTAYHALASLRIRQRSCAEWCFFISGLTVSTVLFGITRSLLILYIFVNSSQTLHNKILESILRAPVLFFNSNPIGKSDTKFLSEYVLLTHLVPNYIFVFENGRDAWKKITVCIYSFYTKSFTDNFSYQIKFEYRSL